MVQIRYPILRPPMAMRSKRPSSSPGFSSSLSALKRSSETAAITAISRGPTAVITSVIFPAKDTTSSITQEPRKRNGLALTKVTIIFSTQLSSCFCLGLRFSGGGFFCCGDGRRFDADFARFPPFDTGPLPPLPQLLSLRRAEKTGCRPETALLSHRGRHSLWRCRCNGQYTGSAAFGPAKESENSG